MCYSAQIRQDYAKFVRAYGATIDIAEFVRLYWDRGPGREAEDSQSDGCGVRRSTH